MNILLENKNADNKPDWTAFIRNVHDISREAGT